MTFVGESAVDDGGPRREYFRLVLAEMMKQSHLLAGPPSCKVPQHNALALRNGEFYLIGSIIVLSLMQGGPAPTFFAPSVVEYLFRGQCPEIPSISDIPDPVVQQKLFEVSVILLLNLIYLRIILMYLVAANLK